MKKPKQIDLAALPTSTAREERVLRYFAAVRVSGETSGGMDDPWRDMKQIQRKFRGDVEAVVARLVVAGKIVDEGDGTYCHHRVYRKPRQSQAPSEGTP